MAFGEEVFYDPFTYREYFKNVGRAYREQATTLIEICRLYIDSPQTQTYTNDDRLQNVLRLADAALSAARRAKKGKTSEATDAFLRVQEELTLFDLPAPSEDVLCDQRTMRLSPSTMLESTSEGEISAGARAVPKAKPTLNLKASLPSGPTKKVHFVILESPHDRRKDQFIINQEIDNSTTCAEIVWNFSRYPKRNAGRITPMQNPHFYLRLSKDPTSYDSRFHKKPLKDFARRLSPNDTIYVLLGKSCRLFIDATKPRIFCNLWKPHQTVVLKDVCGMLESEDIVLRDIGESQDYWYRPSINSASRHTVSGYSDGDSDIVNTQFADARAVIHAAIRAQRVDLMIRDQSIPEPPADSGWKLLPSPEPRAQEPEDRTTPRQSSTHLPLLEYSNPNSSVFSIGASTLFTTSTESFQTAPDMSEILLATREAVGDRAQHIGNEPPSSASHFNPNLGIPGCSGSSLILIQNGSLETMANVSVPLSLSAAAGKRPEFVDNGVDST